MRSFVLYSVLFACLSAIGCAGPMGMGPGCGSYCDSCNDCEGGFGPRHPLASGPIDALRNARRSLTCGGGCGEVYYGEWQNSPPDCVDPCCGSQFVGGAVPCTPFCWQPGALIGGLVSNLYGYRFDDCGCDGGYVSDCGCSDCGVVDGASVIMDEGSMPAVQSCPSCAANRGQQNGQSFASRSNQSNMRIQAQTTARNGTSPPAVHRQANAGVQYR